MSMLHVDENRSWRASSSPAPNANNAPATVAGSSSLFLGGSGSSVWSTSSNSSSIWTTMSGWPTPASDVVSSSNSKRPFLYSNTADSKSPAINTTVAPAAEAKDDLSNLEYQAMATLRELQIELTTSSGSTISTTASSPAKVQTVNLEHLGLSLMPSESASSVLSLDSSVSPSRESIHLEADESDDMGNNVPAGITAVFVGRLPFDLTEKEFQQRLVDFSPVDCCICLNKRKKSKGFGFVNFSSEDLARKFVLFANDAFLFSNQKLPLRVEICRR